MCTIQAKNIENYFLDFATLFKTSQSRESLRTLTNITGKFCNLEGMAVFTKFLKMAFPMWNFNLNIMVKHQS